MGTVNPVGNNVDETWTALCAGKSGIGHLTKFDAVRHTTKIAGELKNFDPLLYVDKKELRRLDEFIVYALACAEMAMKDSGLAIDEGNAERVGTIIGSGIGGLKTIEKEHTVLEQSGPRRAFPFHHPGRPAQPRCGTYLHPIRGQRPHQLPRHGLRRRHERHRHGIPPASRTAMPTPCSRAASRRPSPPSLWPGSTPCGRSRPGTTNRRRPAGPFDRDRDGFVMGEGGGILILEELTLARRRGARIYAEICGFGCTADAYHMAAPPPGHEGAARSMEVALRSCGMEPSAIGYINAHGTATPLNDVYETQAIKRVFGEHSRKLAVSSTKSMTGHLLGGAGGLEAIVAVKAICEGIVPPTINLDNPDEGCDLDYVPHRAKEMNIEAALSNTFGFGGVNAVLAFRKFRD